MAFEFRLLDSYAEYCKENDKDFEISELELWEEAFNKGAITGLEMLNEIMEKRGGGNNESEH